MLSECRRKWPPTGVHAYRVGRHASYSRSNISSMMSRAVTMLMHDG